MMYYIEQVKGNLVEDSRRLWEALRDDNLLLAQAISYLYWPDDIPDDPVHYTDSDGYQRINPLWLNRVTYIKRYIPLPESQYDRLLESWSIGNENWYYRLKYILEDIYPNCEWRVCYEY